MNRRGFVRHFGAGRGDQLYAQVVENVHNSDVMLRETPMVFGAHSRFSFLQKKGFRCVVVTAREGRHDYGTARWAWRFLMMHSFQISLADFHTGSDDTKARIRVDVGISFFVDDNIASANEIVSLGIQCFLFPSPANSTGDISGALTKVSRVKHWSELCSILRAKI